MENPNKDVNVFISRTHLGQKLYRFRSHCYFEEAEVIQTQTYGYTVMCLDSNAVVSSPSQLKQYWPTKEEAFKNFIDELRAQTEAEIKEYTEEYNAAYGDKSEKSD